MWFVPFVVNSPPFHPLQHSCLAGKNRYDATSVIFAALAQLVEHLIRNERVAGSNPASGSSAGCELQFDWQSAKRTSYQSEGIFQSLSKRG